MKAIGCPCCGKSHPPEQVMWSEGNPLQQPRPYHCPQCWQAQRPGRMDTYWKTGTVAEAEGCREHGRHQPAPGGCCLR